MKNNDTVNIIGAGLAGCEAAWQAARAGKKVVLYDMKPSKMSPAHKVPTFAELVCSNSLRADNIENASGLLKEEMRTLNSLIIDCADRCRIPAGGALAVDRNLFTQTVSARINAEPNIEVRCEEISEVPDDGSCWIIATGPLTSGKLPEYIAKLMGDKSLYFYDAAAPIISADSIDMDKAFIADRYDKGDGDYLNCPMNKEQYTQFREALISAERAELHEFEKAIHFEGCMPIEVMAQRGEDTMRFGPLKPVGLTDTHTGQQSYAVVQLRKEDAEGSMYNIVGFQTNLKFPEQKRVFSMIPGLENAEFLRYGVMHRNTFIHSPGKLTPYYMLKEREGLFFAGQITGVEGYIESASSGMLAGINAAAILSGKSLFVPPPSTVIGALSHYVSEYVGKDFQPMKANFGIADTSAVPKSKKLSKTDRFAKVAELSLETLRRMAVECDVCNLL